MHDGNFNITKLALSTTENKIATFIQMISSQSGERESHQLLFIHLTSPSPPIPRGMLELLVFMRCTVAAITGTTGPTDCRRAIRRPRSTSCLRGRRMLPVPCTIPPSDVDPRRHEDTERCTEYRRRAAVLSVYRWRVDKTNFRSFIYSHSQRWQFG